MPLLLDVVGVADVHVAIGTSALAVATSALANFIGHWRVGNVKWSCATIFAAAGIVGASIGGRCRSSMAAESFVPVCSRHDCSQRGYVAVECRW